MSSGWSSASVTFALSREASGLPPLSSSEVGRDPAAPPPTAKELSLGSEFMRDPGTSAVRRDTTQTPPAARYIPGQIYVRMIPYTPSRLVREATTAVALDGFKTVAARSLSTYFTIHVTHYRNCVGVENPDWLEKIGRRVVGELCYAALIVASLVEAAARLILSLPGVFIVIPLLMCIMSDHEFIVISGQIVECFLWSSLLSIFNAAACAIALLKNVPVRILRYENLFPPTHAFWNCLLDIFSSHEQLRIDREARAEERDEWKNNDWNNAFHRGLA